MACLMCLASCPVTKIELNSEEGRNLNITGIITKHFWLRPVNNNEQICVSCWDIVQGFHKFYIRVANVHKHFEVEREFLTVAEEVDPFPEEFVLKSEETNALVDEFFDSEVKVEVNDLDLLPQVEIIEGTEALRERSKRPLRSCRSTGIPPKEIKNESVSAAANIADNDDESEPELPLAMLVDSATRTDIASDEKDLFSECLQSETAETTATPKKKRGRPRKQVVPIEEPSIKSPEIDTDGDTKPSAGPSGTDESVSSSDTDRDTDESWAGSKDRPLLAEVPKRVPVRPKKYGKRPKPLVQPKRMTREEIDRKNAQQAEYDRVIRQFFGNIPCCKCDIMVENFGVMRGHMRATHNEESGYAMCCGRKFHLRKTLAEHVYVHWNPEHYKCRTCERVFQDSRTLELHEATHTDATAAEPKEKKMFQCDKCPKAFTTKAAFEYHAFSKHVPKSEFKFTCPECNKKLPTKRKLKDHMKYMHDPESAIICDKCGKQVRSQTNLKKHHEVEHSDVPRPTPVPVQCEICGTWLRHMSGLKQHMKTMHEDTGGEHRCHICNKTSTNARALKRHIYHNHECERKFKCTMCEKAFKRPQDLREHTSTHTGEVLYTCPNCPMTFFSNANMYKHRQRLHRAAYEADRKKPVPPNIMQQAVGATAAMKMQLAVGASSAFFAQTTNPVPNINPTPN